MLYFRDKYGIAMNIEDFTSRHDDESRNFYSIKANTLAQDKEGHIADDYGATEHEINKEYRKIMNAANERSLFFTATRSETDAVDTQHTQQGQDSGHMTDDRMITAEQLRGKVRENNNLSPQQEDLYNVLIKYQHLTKRPSRCTKFEYEFKIEGSMPTSANSKHIPFALRDRVCDQIQIMLKDDIFEKLFSSYINPLAPVVREGNPLRICVYARRINQQITADRTTVLPLRELIQKIHCASYITTLDLSSSFLQVPLKETPRQWTAFQFQMKVYQLKAVPYGFKNSLSAFIRTLEKVSGDDEIYDKLVIYLDGLVRLLALHNICNRDARVEVDSDECKEEIDV